MSKRIWSESLLEWDKAGAELWNLVAGATGFIPGGVGGPAQFYDFEEQQQIVQQPTIVLENFNPNLTQEKIKIFEIAGISRSLVSKKQTIEDVSIFITEVKFRSK